MKYAFIDEHCRDWSIVRQCSLLSVSTSGFYAWRNRPESPRFKEDKKLRMVIHTFFHNFNGIYGSPRIYREMKSNGYRIGRKRVERLMREMELFASIPKRFVRTTDSEHDDPIAPNLLKQEFSATKPNEKWVGDITYVQTTGGWLFLATVIDLYSRKVVGWSFSRSMNRQIIIDALGMAVENRRPEPGLIFHSDRGSQYASYEYRALLKEHNITASMSRTACCYDNAVAESFFHSLKVEEVYRNTYKNYEHAKTEIFKYIECFYNRQRRHSTIDYLCPEEYEERYYAA
ncbi:MAG: IS3 family transposase [Planctomycetes bacterium]|nr:IS3 family transposase [Planctomycetota bacterium]